MKKPVIGISSNEQANFDGWFIEHYINYTKSETIKVIDDVEALPIIIPVLENNKCIDSYLDMIDGLIVTGGHDVYPLLYTDNMMNECGDVYPKTDFFDINLIKAALARKIPTIVICRGVQIANVAYKGTLYQDVQTELKTEIKHHAPNEGNINVHSIKIIDEDSLFSRLTGLKEQVFVNSIHHQAIKELAPIFKVVAQAEDGVIEIIELKDSKQFFIGTQFHPEILGSVGNENMMKLFRGMTNYIREAKEIEE
ncbi:gamma-glutamyl-gamma-aminobutyrate hydrolase family protein [Erysipelotrichaceae bacterium OttesenSCG-928-M19]|nr:gamma-glutamyl-gamma-aminobutyrate hydrolase family protein [Erysipelotrichaceae bacterium OttesenSCG-928-M19]